MRLLDSDLFHKDAFIGPNYRIIRQIGRGGDGVVYLVCHLPTEQLRAAKRLRADRTEKRLQELTLMKTLRHPSLPGILDVIKEEDCLWLIMEYISGKCISELSGTEASETQFFAIAKQLAETLVYLHTRPVPILHLDIKPSNVLMRPDGHLVLIDFGAAVFLKDGSENGHYGTPGFAAPEQKNPNGKLDVRTDIYGFGALLYYYVYRKIPDLGNKKPAKPDKKIKKLRVSRLLDRCLCENPEGRYADSTVLYQAVCAAEKRYANRKSLQKASGALGLLAIVLLFTAAQIRGRTGGTDYLALQKEETYVQLLDQAEKLGLSQASGCYEKAAMLYPDRARWCFALLERIGRDCLFEQEEEEILKKLLYMVLPGRKKTFLEVQKEKPEIYGELSYRLGILYWYFYEGAGGRSAAASWFEQAISGYTISGKTGKSGTPSWLESARVHADMGKYRDALGRRDENGGYLADYETYWKDLQKLWDLEHVKEENTGLRIQIADELLSCMILHAHELDEAGESYEKIRQVLQSVEQFVDRNPGSDEEQRNREQQCRAAEAAVKRAYGKGEQNFEEE